MSSRKIGAGLTPTKGRRQHAGYGRWAAWKRIFAATLILLPMTTPAVQQNTPAPQAATPQGQAGRNAGVRPKRAPERQKGQAGVTSTAGSGAKGAPAAAAAQSRESAPEALQAYTPVLAAADFNLLGLSVTAGPATQTVPKNTPTSVLTSLDVPAGGDSAAAAAAVNPNYRVRGELTGPSLSRPVTVEARIGEPLRLPALSAAGDHVLQNLRVVDTGTPEQEVVAPVTPDACGVVVIDRLLVSEVHVNELTYDQIVQSGINISDDSYSYFNFTLGLATNSSTQQINIPVAFPGVGVPDPRPVVGLPSAPNVGVEVPVPVPDVLPVMLEVDGRRDDLDLPDGTPVRIPGVVVFPGRVGLLHQFFEATVIVANGAPNGTPLVVRQLHARIKLPDAGTPGSAGDDPLRIAETQQGGRVTELEIHGLGADNRYGTPDDIDHFAPGQSGQASFLVEGLKEGLHTINFDLEGTLEGLPGGPVTVRGEVPGAVLVRDASFSVTFTHPSVVRAGQEYELAMTLYNSGQRDIQGAVAELSGGGVSGAELLGQDSRRQFTTVKRGDSATVMWKLRASVTGAVTASYAKVGEGVESGLALVTGVGDRGVPLSPDSLMLPDTVRNLPPDAVEAARGLLGQAWSVANAPPGALPEGVTSVDKRTVVERAVELGVAGLRAGFGEPAEVSLLTLARDWLGELQQSPDPGFADVLRGTAAGYRWYDAVGAVLRQRLDAGASPRELLTRFSDAESPRSAFVAALVTQAPGAPVFGARLVGGGGALGFGATPEEREGGSRSSGTLKLEAAEETSGAVTSAGQMLIVSKPADELWSLEVSGWREGTADISLLVPAGDGAYRQFVFTGLHITQGSRHRVRFRPTGGSAPTLEEFRDGSFQPAGVTATLAATLAEPAPRVVGVVQVTPEVIAGGDKYGRLVGVLFSKPMLKANAETAANYTVGGGALKGSNPPEQVGGTVAARGAHMDYGDRFVFLSLDTPVGPYIERDLSVGGVTDRRGNATAVGAKTPISMRVSPEGAPPGAYLTGRVMGADGAPVAGAPVLYWTHECDETAGGLPKDPTPIAQRVTDAQGRYAFDYVRDGDCGPVVVTVRNPTTLSEKRLTTPVAYDGQHMTLDVVFLARGKVRGAVTSGGRPLANAVVQVVPSLDAVGTKVVQTDASGNYFAEDIPVGNVTVLAVGAGQAAAASGISAGTVEGPGATAVVNVSLQNISGAVRGRVVNPDAAQTPASGALVVAYAAIPGFNNQERGDSASPVGYAFSGRDGSFAIENLPVGTIKLEVTDYVTRLVGSQQVQLSDAAPAANGVVVVLPGYGTVKGKVVDESGNFMPLAIVTGAGRSVQADALGEYTLPNMPAGTHELTAIDPQTLMTGVARAQVRLGQTTDGINIPILRAATITGRVMLNEGGAAVPAARVYVSTDGYHKFQTDEQGRYTVRNVQPNTELKLRFVDPVRNLVLNMPVYLSPGEQLTRDAALRTGSIHGRVTQPDGTNGAAAAVQVYAPVPVLREGRDWGLADSSRPLSTQSAGDGVYTMAGVNPGPYRVVVSNNFFPTPVSAGGALAPGADDEVNLSLVSTLAGKIQGRVFRSDGETPAGPGIRVTLGGGALADVTVQTDANGHYEFAEVFAEGSYTLTATDPVSGQTERVRISAQRNKDLLADLRLRGVGALRVTVVDGAGNPVPSAQLTLDGSEYPNMHRFAELLAEDSGVYRFENLPEGRYAISASRNGLGGRAAASVAVGTTVEVTVQLQATGIVRGRVLMPDGETAIGLADVELKIGGRTLGFAVTSDADADRGAFIFPNVPAGEFNLDVLDNRTGRAGRASGQLSAQGETVSLDVKLQPVGAVAGRVTANGQPVDHALVEIFASGTGVRYERLKATTDQEGHFRFTGIPAGPFQLWVTGAPGGQTGSASGIVSGAIEPLPDTVVDIALEPSVTVTGKVYAHDGARPVNGARVRVSVGPRRFEATTDESGTYQLAYVPLGEIRVRAEAPSGLDRGEGVPYVATEPGATVTADIRLGGVGAVSGTAFDSTGLPLSNGAVTFTNDDWRDAPLVVVAAVDANGRYEVKGVPAGPFSLRLTVPNRVGVGSASAELSADQTLDLPVRLEDAGQVVGRLKSVDGISPSAGADVMLNLVTSAGKSLRFYAHTDAAGAWRVANVPLGNVSASAYDNLTGGVARYRSASLSSNNQTLDLGEASLDNTNVRVESMTPQNGTTGVSPAAPAISILFSEPVEPSTVTASTVRLVRGSESVPAILALSEDRRTLTLTPAGRLADLTLYSVVVTANVADLAGNSLAGEVRSSFTTSDITAPFVQSINPPNGASGVPLDSAIAVTFNEPLDRSQPLDAILSVTPSDLEARPVMGSATLDESGRVLTYRPTAALEDATVYRLRVAGQRDVAGNVQGDAYSSSFISYVTPNQGAVRVEVRGAAGALIQGVRLKLVSMDGTLEATSGLDGGYRFKPVPLGDVTIQATDPLTGLRGKASGRLNAAGETLTLSVSLRSAGVVTGTVFRAGGTTPAAGAEVEVRSDSGELIEAVMTGTDGRYAVDFVPLGGFTVEARDAATGDRGRAANQISVNGETRTINVALNGLGSVRVSVRDAGDRPVAGAQVRLSSQTQFGGSQTATSAADGVARFDRVFAGNFSVSATDPATGLGGSQQGSVTNGTTADVLVRLRPAGTITGRVFAPDGATAAGEVTVRLLFDGYYTEREVKTGPDGAFRFETVPAADYVIEVFDASARKRARADGVSLTQNGQTVSRDLTLVGVGTVKGRVLGPDDAPVPNQPVTVRSNDRTFGGDFNAVTDAQGSYRVAGVPAGAFRASADRSEEQLQGETQGRISLDGEEVTADIKLVSNAVSLPVGLRDGNSFDFDVQQDGSVLNGSGIYGYSWDWVYGSSRLSLVVNGQEMAFNGSGVGAASLGGRELSIRQQGLAGLDVTRRVFVPEHGYFARYVEVLRNPTASPITVDVRVVHNHGYSWYGGPEVMRTSSGDQTLEVSGAAGTPDRWVTLDDTRDDESSGSLPPVAYIFDGAGAPEHVGAATYGGANGLQLSYEWRQVTIGSGQTVAYVHFGVQQIDRAGAQAAAERLSQLPPEALDNIDAQDAAAVRNFVVPTDGVSTVNPLPRLDGAVTVQLLASDATTPVPDSDVSFRSRNPLYGRTYTGRTDEAGRYIFATASGGQGTATIPTDGFTVKATHGVTQATATAEGVFAPGANEAMQKLVFNGTAIVRGSVKRHNGVPVTSGSVFVSSPRIFTQVPVRDDGTYEITGLIAGTGYNLNAVLFVEGGSSLSSPSTAVTPAAGQILTADLVIPPTGAVAGAVRTAAGAPAPGVSVRIINDEKNLVRSTSTDNSGAYLLPDLLAGGYTIQAFEPTTNTPVSAHLTVSPDQTTAQDLTLVGLGRVHLLVRYPDGMPAGDVLTQLSTLGREFSFVGYTDSAGRLTIENVAVGAFTVRVLHPANQEIYSDTQGTLNGNGEVIAVTATLPGLGSVSGVVRRPDGSVVPSAIVNLEGAGFVPTISTDEAGRYVFGGLPVGRELKLRVWDPEGGVRDVTFRLEADGEARTLDVTLAARAAVRVTVFRNDGSTPYAGVGLRMANSASSGLFFAGYTDASGQLTIQNVPEGNFNVQAEAPGGNLVGVTEGIVTAADNGNTLAVTIRELKSFNLEGSVRAGDGQTPVDGAGVLVFERSGGGLVTRGRTDQNGAYHIENVRPVAGGYRVAVVAPSSMTAADQFVADGDSRDTVTLDYTLPVGVVKGRVLRSDGVTPLANPNVSVECDDAGGVTHFWKAQSTDAAGNFTVIGEARGSVLRLRASDTQTGLSSAVVSITIDEVTTPTAADIIMPRGVEVVGTVYDADDRPVAEVNVNFAEPGDKWGQDINTDEQGAFNTGLLRPGTYTLRAVDWNNQLFGAPVTVNVPGDNDSFRIDLHLPASGVVRGTVFKADGTPAAGASVLVENYENNWNWSYPYFTATADASGNYEVQGVQAGLVHVTAQGADDWSVVGVAEGPLAGKATATINVTLANAFNFYNDYLNLDGADGFRYNFYGDGEIPGGGRIDGSPTFGYRWSHTLHFGNTYFNNFMAGTLEAGGREAVVGTFEMDGLKVTRKFFSPQSGGFTRYLEVIRNPTANDLNIPVELDVSFGSSYSTRVVVPPAAAGGLYAVTDAGGGCCTPALANVFGGPGARVLPPSTEFSNGQPSAGVKWNVTVPAGQTIIIMHFTAQRGPDDAAGAQAQAEALVNLSDPHALDDMTAEEKAQVVNFQIPASLGSARSRKPAAALVSAGPRLPAGPIARVSPWAAAPQLRLPPWDFRAHR